MAEHVKGYVLDHRLGAGGFAEVFAGRRVGAAGFARPVAIKRILPGCSEDTVFRSMFVAEAQLSARLSHSNIVAVHDFDEDEAGRLFLVMELVDGTDLHSLLQTGPLPLPLVLWVVCEILRGLGHAHDLPASAEDAVLGVIHRDVSPQNVLIAWDGSVKVSDFGIAKARSASKATASSTLKGKIAYMSPEQASNIALDGRSDLYSVGVMLWEMLCHRRLIEGESLQAQLKTVLFDAVPAPSLCRPDLPAELERITMTLLEKDRERRYRNAAAAIAALKACAEYPAQNGRELLSTLLLERLPERARTRVAGNPTQVEATRPIAQPAAMCGRAVGPIDPMETIDYSAPPRSRRKILATMLAGALVAGIGGGVYMRHRDGRPDEKQRATSSTSTLGAMPSNTAPSAAAPSILAPQPPNVTQDKPSEHLIEAKRKPPMLIEPAPSFAAGRANAVSEPASSMSSLSRRASPIRPKSPATSSERKKAAAPDGAWVKAKGDVVQFKDD